MKIKIEKLTETEKHLLNLLRDVWDSNEFIIGVLNALKDDDERQEVIEFIESNENATTEEIDLLALDINQAREDNIIIDSFFADLKELAKHI